MRSNRILNLTISSLFTSAALGMGGLALANSAVATQPMAATSWVNMRSGPSTSNGVLQVVAPNEVVTASGSVQGGWYQVTTKNGLTGWIYQSYLRATAASAPNSGSGAGSGSSSASSSTVAASAASSAPAASGQATVTADVNVRSGPGTSYSIVSVARKGSTVATTGVTNGGWTQVLINGTARWISTNYLTAGGGSTGTGSKLGSSNAGNSSLPVVAGQIRTTANLYLRSAGNASASYASVLPGKTVVDVTGRTTAEYTEIIWKGQLRWIATRYTTAVGSSGPSTPAAPVSVGKVYVNVGSLYVRATSAADGAIITTIYRGQALDVTGRTAGDRTEVIWQGVARWVFTAYVTSTPPAASLPSNMTFSGIDRLVPSARTIVDHVVANYPRIRTIYGWRASSDYSSDHPNGRAVDVMIPNWTDASNADHGWEIARYFAENASKFNISYIIYRQQIWNASYPTRGWRAMEDRGGATANHYDHVHISVRS